MKAKIPMLAAVLIAVLAVPSFAAEAKKPASKSAKKTCLAECGKKNDAALEACKAKSVAEKASCKKEARAKLKKCKSTCPAK